MAVNLGVHVSRQDTAVPTKNEAATGVPFVVGTAPVQSAAKPAKPNRPVLVRSWDEAVEQLGFDYDWKKYTLCEFMYSNFQLFGCRPVIFCNVLDPDTMKTRAGETSYEVSDHRVRLPLGTIIDDTMEVRDENGEAALMRDTDYSVFYDTDACVVELLEGYSKYDEAAKLTITSNAVDLSAVGTAQIALGVAQVDTCITSVGTAPDLICAPGWSGKPEIAALMAAKAGAIGGLFSGKAVVDIPCGADGVRDCLGLPDYKKENSLTDPNQIVCWPMVQFGDYRFHLSTQLCGLMAAVDAGNRGIPYESPSNKNLNMDACVLEDGTEVSLTWDQVNLIAGSWGIVTAVNFLDSGWVAKGNYTACYPGNTDIKDQFIPVSRMFDYIGNTLIRTLWSKLDKPMTPAMRDSILQTCNIWLGGLCGSGYLYGARVELLATDNPLTDLMGGIIKLRVYNASPVPLQEADLILEYDVSYMESALAS